MGALENLYKIHNIQPGYDWRSLSLEERIQMAKDRGDEEAVRRLEAKWPSTGELIGLLIVLAMIIIIARHYYIALRLPKK